jgi:hypothetical protein
VAVQAAQIIIGPLLQPFERLRIHPQQEWSFRRHDYWYSVPVLMTGWVDVSPHSTTSRLETIAALRS